MGTWNHPPVDSRRAGGHPRPHRPVPPPATRRDRGAAGQGGPAAAERGRPAAGAGAVGRPGLRRAAGAGAAEVRQGGRPVLQRHRPGDRGAETAGLGRRRGSPGRRERPWYGRCGSRCGSPTSRARHGLFPTRSISAATSRQLAAARTEMRGVVAVAHRCPCGEPDVVRTEPRLPDGTPFPTTYYATCPRLTGRVSTSSRRA